jgi:hypothetical protein
MWLLLLLACCPSFSAGHQSVELGTNATISVEGITGTRGCKFLLQNTSGVITCCFAKRDFYCPSDTKDSCRKEEDYTVMAEVDQCVLKLPDFKVSDVGTYRAIFPDCLKCNRNVEVVIWTGVGWAPVLITILLLILIVVVIVLLYVYVWKPHHRRKIDQEKNIHKHIVQALKAEDSVRFNKQLGGRSVLNIRDEEQDASGAGCGSEDEGP